MCEMLSSLLRPSVFRMSAGMCPLSICPVRASPAITVRRCVQLGRGLGESEGRRPVTRVQKYVFGRYMQYLHKFQQVLESEFPAAFRLYRVFTVGVRDFVRDAKSFALLARKVHSTGLGSLSRRELELYFRTPRDMRAVAPVLLVSALPLAQNVVFPLAYLFPRQLLSRHFWSLQQRAEFALHEHKRRLLYMRPVLRHLQARWRLVSCTASVCSPSGDGARCANMASCCGIWTPAMAREGVTDMSLEELYYACFLRGLNPQNLPRDQMVSWLSQWALVSGQMEPGAASLLLHCPLLLGYNQPTNWALRH
ncbi:LETM1 domain-containing protein 1-like [Pollicipes pollicipes]|uniref:LETM1 domain-containing protein 1-like n=1 Tax=Pollicipes pollicipes TaxID=41117 RepID=UPI00188495B5|nr:LETM1 domain-containing protein 1-like [Pollicipes pollicipes]